MGIANRIGKTAKVLVHYIVILYSEVLKNGNGIYLILILMITLTKKKLTLCIYVL